MNHKEEASELVEKFMDIENLGRFSNDGFSEFSTLLAKKQAKQCALIAIKFAKENPLNSNGYNNYLDDIKKEIELL